MKKRITILLLAACIGTSARLAAAPRGEQAARHIAEQFLKGQAVAGKRASATDRLTLAATSADLATAKKRSATTAWYVFNQGTEAFVIVSGDDRMTDILGYSTERAFDTEGMPDNLRAWLASYTALAENVTTSQAPGMPATRTSTDGYPETVTPLLGDINYSQDEPYNRQCPLWNETRCITGCGATAMATILRYWEYPSRGTGSHAYYTAQHGIPCSFDFEATVFDWERILPTYAGVEYSEEEAEAVANLMLACGVAGEADYCGEDGTGMRANYPAQGLLRYFGYNPYMRYLERPLYDAQEWMDVIKEELSEGRPVIYGGTDEVQGGHAFCIDGYDHNGMVHVNWGWNGQDNGYYEIETLNPYEEGEGNGFSLNQNMIVGIAPANIYDDPKSAFSINGFEMRESLGGTIAVIIESMYNLGYDASGRTAFIAEKEGVQTILMELFPYEDLQNFYGMGDISFFWDGMGELDPGTYRIYMASRTDGEPTWTKAKGSGIDEYTLTMHENGGYELQEGRPTGIGSVTGKASGADKLVDVVALNGVKIKTGVKSSEALNGLQQGIYIVDGKKYVVK